MAAQFSPVHAGTLVLVGLLNVGLGALLFRIRSARSVRALFVFLLGVSLWTIPQGLLLVASSSTVSYLLVCVINVGASIMSVGLFHFGLAYSDRTEWLRWRRIGLCYLTILPWAVLFVTNPVHELMYVSQSYAGALLPVIETQEPLFWLYVFYNWGWSGLGTYLLFLEYLDVRGVDVYEKQAGLIVISPVIPFVANVFAFSGATTINYTVWGFGATGLLIATAIYQYRWLDLVPIGRDQVIEGMRDGYLVIDEDRRVVDANQSAAQFLDIQDPIGAQVGDLLPGRFALLDGERTERQFSLDGSVVDASVSTVTTRDGVGYVLMLRDVTEKRRVEKRFQALIENVTDVITVVDDDGTITYQSPSVGDVLGYRAERLVGTSVFDIVHPEDRDEALGNFRAVCEEPGAETSFEYRVQHDDGSWRVFDGVSINLLDNDIVDGVVITSRDVTSRKRREQQLLKQNEYLDEFAGIVSHDLQGPLMAIRGDADRAISSGDVSHVSHVLDAADRMDQLVDDLLHLARTGRQIEQTAPVKLADATRSAWRRVRSSDAELVVDTEKVVAADVDRLEQLLENLFRNAVEHGSTSPRSSSTREDADERSSSSPRSTTSREDAAGTSSGEPSVTGAPEDAVDDGASGAPSNDTVSEGEGLTVTVGTLPIGFYVEDDGPGIPPSKRERVFERGHTTAESGSGLGLGIVRQIAGAHGWSIRATAGATGGARFEITGVEER